MLLHRKIEKKIEKWLNKDEIILLNGARQVGKTYLLKLIQEELKKRHISQERIFYLNLEDLDVLNNLNQSPKNILNYIKDKKNKNYFLIDEIQYLDNPSNFLKFLFDEYRDQVKIITTGSSSLELKAKLQDSLVGRKIVFDVNPLDFEEFLQFKQADILSYFYKENIPFEIHGKLKDYLREYLLFGGMPRVVLVKENSEKKQLLSNYVSDYINKDIRYIGRIENILKFNQFVKVLSGQIGQLLNINEISNTLNLKRKEAEFYLELLENTFVLNRVYPYYRNIRSQISKMSKTYFFDLGIRNQVLNNFAEIDSRSDNGNLFENFIYLELKNRVNKENIYFYRTIHKTEIDFILEKNNIVYPIETKYQSKPVKSRALVNFLKIKEMNAPFSYLVNLDINKEEKKVKFLSFMNFNLWMDKFLK